MIGAITYAAYQYVYGINTNNDEPIDLYIPSTADYHQVQDILSQRSILKSGRSFDVVARLMKYDQSVKAGRYVIDAHLSNRALVTLLRSGIQTPVNVTISSGRVVGDIAQVVANIIEADSSSIHKALMDSVLWHRHHLNASNMISLIIPNTYQFYWNTDATAFVDRMEKEHSRFWTDTRRQQAAALNLSPIEVYTLASVVEKESNLNDERPIIAGLYLNRLRQGIPLQADPTVVFGIGDFTIRRVLNRHLELDTPYNTYKRAGLPIGPICMPSILSIDAVLQPENHDYLFMCAKPGYNNGHLFAKSNAQHERNARLYHQWLNSEGIKG